VRIVALSFGPHLHPAFFIWGILGWSCYKLNFVASFPILLPRTSEADKASVGMCMWEERRGEGA
jgi:hypothetical protein